MSSSNKSLYTVLFSGYAQKMDLNSFNLSFHLSNHLYTHAIHASIHPSTDVIINLQMQKLLTETIFGWSVCREDTHVTSTGEGLHLIFKLMVFCLMTFGEVEAAFIVRREASQKKQQKSILVCMCVHTCW